MPRKGKRGAKELKQPEYKNKPGSDLEERPKKRHKTGKSNKNVQNNYNAPNGYPVIDEQTFARFLQWQSDQQLQNCVRTTKPTQWFRSKKNKPKTPALDTSMVSTKSAGNMGTNPNSKTTTYNTDIDMEQDTYGSSNTFLDARYIKKVTYYPVLSNETKKLMQDISDFDKKNPFNKTGGNDYNTFANTLLKRKEKPINHQTQSYPIYEHATNLLATRYDRNVLLTPEKTRDINCGYKNDKERMKKASFRPDLMFEATSNDQDETVGYVLVGDAKPDWEMKGLFCQNNIEHQAYHFARQIQENFFVEATYHCQEKKENHNETYMQYKNDRKKNIQQSRRNQYKGISRAIGQLITMPTVTGTMPFTFISDTNTILIAKIEPLADNEKQNDNNNHETENESNHSEYDTCYLEIAFYPLFILTELSDNQIEAYQSKKHQKKGGKQFIKFQTDKMLKQINNPLSTVIGTLIELNKQSKLNNKRFHCFDPTAKFVNPVASNVRVKSKRFFSSIDSFFNQTPSCEFEPWNCQKYAARRECEYGDNGEYGCVMLHKISSMNKCNQLYWFKIGKESQLKQEFDILNKLKKSHFKYLIKDYALKRDIYDRLWLITQHCGDSLDYLLNIADPRRITDRQCDYYVNKVKKELNRCEYEHPDFALRNILIKNTVPLQITLIDFETL